MFGLRKSLPECSILVLFGGSFDPPHRAHLEFARLMADRTPGAGVVMVPAARSPHKTESPGAAGFERAAMLRHGLADVGLDPKGVWTIELDCSDRRGKRPSYWVETVERAFACECRKAGIEDLRFVIGSDQLAAFDRWRGPHEILKLARPIVLVRGDEDTPVGGADAVVDEAVIERVMEQIRASGQWSDEELAAFADGFIIGQPIRAVSSTRVRELLSEDPEAEELERLLTPGVIRYIREHGLYGQR
jgi:nicotinate-nucleotide adenylyltransferase